MSKILRAIYRLFFKNTFVRWVLMLAIAIWGVRELSERGLALHKAPLSKTVFSIPYSTISTFTIRQNEDNEITFTLIDTSWLAVKNHITTRLPFDSVAQFLNIFEKMDSYSTKVLTTEEMENIQNQQKCTVKLTQKNNTTHSFSVFYQKYDSLSRELLTYIKLSNENVLYGIKGNLGQILGKHFDDFRDKTLVDFKGKYPSVLTLKIGKDSLTFVHQNTWLLKNPPLSIVPDSMQKYVNHLSLLRGSKFYEGDRDILTQSKIEHQLTALLPTEKIVLTSFKLEKGYILHSSQNKEAYFWVDSTTHIFPNISKFLLKK
ncbi:MAG: hypothetical protein JNL70_24345 [Saprospiraceae bacterium]|nr:hypothetical protein [Saprospiraceae bacterium]